MEPIKQTLIWEEYSSDNKPIPKYRVLTYAPAHRIMGSPQLVFNIIESENIKPDVLLWAYIKDPIPVYIKDI